MKIKHTYYVNESKQQRSQDEAQKIPRDRRQHDCKIHKTN